MQKLFTGLMCAGAMMMAGAAVAEDPSDSSKPAMTHEQMMKDCMDKAAMRNDGMTPEQNKANCKKEVKMQMDEMKKDKDSMKKKY